MRQVEVRRPDFSKPAEQEGVAEPDKSWVGQTITVLGRDPDSGELTEFAAKVLAVGWSAHGDDVHGYVAVERLDNGEFDVITTD